MPDDTIAGGMDPAAGLGYLRAEIDALREIFRANDLGLPVPACPGWDLAALAGHLGTVHRRVLSAMGEGDPRTDPLVPEGSDELLAWFDEGAARLVDRLATGDPAAPCWTFGPEPRTMAFWFRRQAHEHAVHLHDARTSVGAPSPIDPALAVDGIDEVVTMFFPRQVALERIAPLERSLGLRTTDAPGREWLLAGDGTSGTGGGSGRGVVAAAEAVVSGPAEALYLLVWGRLGLDDPRVTVTGDPEAARAVLSTAIVP